MLGPENAKHGHYLNEQLKAVIATVMIIKVRQKRTTSACGRRVCAPGPGCGDVGFLVLGLDVETGSQEEGRCGW